MSVVTAVVSHLLNDAGVAAVVGARVYPTEIPPATSATPNVLPLLTYRLLDDPPMRTHDKKDTRRARLQIDGWGGSYKSSHAAADAVYAALHGYKGAMGSEGLHVGASFLKEKRDNDNTESVELFNVEMVFEIHYKE